ncbi:hypothetical protein UT300007_01110 [Clostridium sp. CTA-7]
MGNKERKNSGVSLGIVFGSGLGIALGIIFNELLWGIIIGTGVGLTLGSIYDSKNNNNDDAEKDITNN